MLPRHIAGKYTETSPALREHRNLYESLPMKIESVDLFYLAMPVIKDIADGSQDALLVRVCGGGLTGWGECEASPLVSIANWCCPMSHAACRPVRDAVLGQTLDRPEDILRINRTARALGLDIAQTDHTLSGIDIALWDLLGQGAAAARLQAAGLSPGVSEDALCVAAFRRHAAADAGESQAVAQRRLSSGEVRLGPLWPRLGRNRPRSRHGRSRGLGQRRRPVDRRRHGLVRRRGTSGAAA